MSIFASPDGRRGDSWSRLGRTSWGNASMRRSAAADASGHNTWTTRRDRPARRPRRITRRNSWLLVSRAAAGSTTRRSGGQRAATPATTRGHDRAAGPRTHAQPEPVLPRPAAVVRLKGALALGHGRLPVTTARWPQGHDGSVRCPRPQAAAAAVPRPDPSRYECAFSATPSGALRPDISDSGPENVAWKSSAATCPLVKRGTLPGYAVRIGNPTPGWPTVVTTSPHRRKQQCTTGCHVINQGVLWLRWPLVSVLHCDRAPGMWESPGSFEHSYPH